MMYDLQDRHHGKALAVLSEKQEGRLPLIFNDQLSKAKNLKAFKDGRMSLQTLLDHKLLQNKSSFSILSRKWLDESVCDTFVYIAFHTFE